jgi:predicted small secreted protein
MPKAIRIALVAVAFVAAACSSDSSSSSSTSTTPSAAAPTSASASTTPVADYAAGVCTAISSFRTDVQQEQSSFNPNKKSWITCLSGMQKSVQTLVADIDALGTPDVSNGQEAASTIKADFEKLQQDIQTLKDKSSSLSTNDAATFVSSFQTMIKQFQTDMAGFGQDLQTIGASMDTAFANASECKGLVGGGSASPSP